jgi:hypothetical protein
VVWLCLKEVVLLEEENVKVRIVVVGWTETWMALFCEGGSIS